MNGKSELECKFCAGVIRNLTGAKIQGSGPWKGYDFQLWGHMYDREPPEPPTVRGRRLAEFKRLGESEAGTWGLLNACRITHESGLESIVHWWPSHGIKAEVWNIGEQASGDLLRKIINLFASETRGAEERFGEAEIARAVRNLGPKATQRAVARRIGVTPRALQMWAAKNNLGGWPSIRSQYEKGELAAAK